MRAFQLISSFRVRLLLVLAVLLVMTLGVQYYLNLLSAQRNARIVAEQEQALAAGIELGVKAMSTRDYLITLRKQARQPLLEEQAGRVTNILVVDDKWQVRDSLNPDYNPEEVNGVLQYKQLRDVPLPPLINAGQLGSDDNTLLSQRAKAPTQSRAGEPRAFPFPVETDKGRWYVIVALGRANMATSIWNREAARPLLYTLAVLLITTFFTAVLVWRFTRPIKDLSNAAQRVAAGQFDFKVQGADRSDEMGQLVLVFNEMISKLGRTRELEAQLHQAEQSAVVGRLASAIAHEIRNPLNYINLTLDHVRTALAPEDPQKRATFNRLADQLKAEVARINTRISEFLNYTRPAKLELRPVDLRYAAEDALRMVEVQAAESNIKLSIESEGDVPPVMADSEALRSVFTNLLINGLQAIDGEGGSLSIRLSAEEMGRIARIEIQDTGGGIAPEAISQVFEPYFSTKETGTGLGLAIVKKAIDDHGGTISVRSKQGSGTTFIITLPTERKDEG
ncbi:MAG TPA: ATP-binding protein [Pyrinomonadaceae bacterium]|jgi:signal transduction histidine kinase